MRVATNSFGGSQVAKSENFMAAVSGLSKDEFQKKFHRPEGHVFDHIIPVCAFNLLDPEHLVRCCYWQNIRIVPHEVNQEKGEKHSCADVMSLPWVGTPDALAAAKRFISSPEDRWRQMDWSKSNEQLAAEWNYRVRTIAGRHPKN